MKVIILNHVLLKINELTLQMLLIPSLLSYVSWPILQLFTFLLFMCIAPQYSSSSSRSISLEHVNMLTTKIWHYLSFSFVKKIFLCTDSHIIFILNHIFCFIGFTKQKFNQCHATVSTGTQSQSLYLGPKEDKKDWGFCISNLFLFIFLDLHTVLCIQSFFSFLFFICQIQYNLHHLPHFPFIIKYSSPKLYATSSIT